LPRIAKYGRMPLSGHMVLLVAPRYTQTPLRKGSVLDCLIVSFRYLGLSLLSMVMLLKERWHDLSNKLSPGTVNSLTLRKAKNAKQQAAYIMV